MVNCSIVQGIPLETWRSAQAEVDCVVKLVRRQSLIPAASREPYHVMEVLSYVSALVFSWVTATMCC
jgi:hypothetical protein